MPVGSKNLTRWHTLTAARRQLVRENIATWNCEKLPNNSQNSLMWTIDTKYYFMVKFALIGPSMRQAFSNI
jgi:hypothetical protein